MATFYSTAQVSSGLLSPSLCRSLSSKKLIGARCALSIPKWNKSRRLVSTSLFLSHFLFPPQHAVAGTPFHKYVKRKKLDPLEAYVPAVILAEFQIKDLEKTLDVKEPQFSDCRSLLSSGPAASLRLNSRAVAQYADDAGNGKIAFNDVDRCLRALEDLDSLLHASRNDPGASVGSMKEKIVIALNALDSLLQTVPLDVLDKGKAIADAYRTPEDAENDISDPELKQLESILSKDRAYCFISDHHSLC